MVDHVSQLVRGCFYQLRRIKSIRRLIPTSTAVTLVNSFLVSRVDYCNSLLSGLPTCQLERLQSVLNSAARLIYGRTKSDHVTDLLRDNLHCLRIPQRIAYKLCLITYMSLNNQMPDYIADFCFRVADNQSRSRLRSSSKNLLQVPAFRELPQSSDTVPSRSLDPLPGTVFPTMSERRHHWKHSRAN